MLRTVTGCLALSFLATSVACAQSPAPINTVRYTCDQGRSLVVQYFTGAVRSATITARTHTTLLEIHKDQLGPVLADRAELIA